MDFNWWAIAAGAFAGLWFGSLWTRSKLRRRHRDELDESHAWFKEKVDECVALRREVSKSERDIAILEMIIDGSFKAMKGDGLNGN